jgi:hypothetical protein
MTVPSEEAATVADQLGELLASEFRGVPNHRGCKDPGPAMGARRPRTVRDISAGGGYIDFITTRSGR